MFSVGISIGRPSSERGNPRRHSAASDGVGDEAHPALPEEVVVGADLHLGADGGVGHEQIDRVPGEGVEELLGARLPAHDLDRLGEPQGGLDQPLGHELRHDVRHPHHEAHGAAGGPAADRLHHLPARREDLVRVAVDEPAHLREREPPPGLAQQLLREDGLQPVDLRADRGGREPQLLGRRPEAARPDDGPEVEQVVVVEPLHGVSFSLRFYRNDHRTLSNCRISSRRLEWPSGESAPPAERLRREPWERETSVRSSSRVRTSSG